MRVLAQLSKLSPLVRKLTPKSRKLARAYDDGCRMALIFNVEFKYLIKILITRIKNLKARALVASIIPNHRWPDLIDRNASFQMRHAVFCKVKRQFRIQISRRECTPIIYNE